MKRLKCDFKVLGPVQTNCYFLYDEDSRECVIVDPGDEFEKIKKHIESKELKLKAVLLTHGHFDHVTAMDKVREEYKVPVYASELEKAVLKEPGKNLSGAMGFGTLSTEADIYLKDGEAIELLGREIRCLSTPGHTEGGMCYYLPQEAILFSGDTLFEESVGRTDFPTSSMSELIRSIREKIFVLPNAVKVYPGHGLTTSVEHEKMFNPFAVE